MSVSFRSCRERDADRRHILKIEQLGKIENRQIYYKIYEKSEYQKDNLAVCIPY